MTQTVREFVNDSYQIVSSNSPTVPLHGNDQSKGIQFLNELVQSYSGTGLMLTVAKEITHTLVAGDTNVTFGETGQDVNEGRLANISDAWLVLEGVTYPLVELSDNEFFSSYKYQPLLGLPIFVIMQPMDNTTKLILYPGCSQGYELHIYGKFQKFELTSNDTMAGFSAYFIRFLRLALAKELARYKGRMAAWTKDLQEDYILAKKEMESISQVNLMVNSPNENQLNGAYRTRAGI